MNLGSEPTGEWLRRMQEEHQQRHAEYERQRIAYEAAAAMTALRFQIQVQALFMEYLAASYQPRVEIYV